LRCPTIPAKTQSDCSSLVLAEKLNAARSQVVGPLVANAFVFWKVARRRDDQSGPHGIKERTGAGLPGMMLSFDDDVAVEIQTGGQERLFRFPAAVRHKQN